MRKTRWMKLLCLTLAFLMLAGCGTNSNDNTNDDSDLDNSPVENTPNGFVGTSGGGSKEVYSAKDSLIFRINADLNTLDPHKTSGTGNERIVQHQFYEGLFAIDTFNGSDELNNRLAESYKYLDEGKTELEISIRQGVKFHNGEEMTAEDVVFSLNRCMNTGFNSVITNVIDSVEATSDYTVVITLKYAYSPIIRLLASPATYIVSKTYTEADEGALDRKPCGTGPFVIDEWITGDSISFHAFPDYWRGEAAIKTGKFVIIADESAYLISLQNGEVDTSNSFGDADRAIVESDPNLGYDYIQTASGGRCILFNCEEGLFSDVRMRQAVAMAVDREAIWTAAYDSTGSVMSTQIPSTLPEGPENFEPLPRDLERAKQLVAEAGYPNGVTVTMPTIDAANYSRATVVIQENLAQIGINVEIELMARAAWNERIITNSDFEISYWAIVPDFFDADAILYKFHSSNLNGKGNFFCYSNPELDELLDEGRKLETGDERNAVYEKALEIMRDDAVVVTVHTSERAVAFNKNLQGMKASPEQKYYIYDYWWAE